MRVLVAEKSAPPGSRCSQRALRRRGGTDGDDLEAAIGDYDGILIRSATKLDRRVIDQATNLKAIGRAGVGVDNVDVAAATKRGIVVANAPQSNVVTAAEHTLALLLALARNVPQAHASSIAGRWDRSKYSGIELMDKTLGILGFGRIGQLVAAARHGLRDARRRLRPVRRRRALPRARRREGGDLRRRLRRRPTSSRSTCPRRRRPRAGSTPRRWPSARTACAC